MPKILVLGDKGVGKSTFISKIGEFDNNGSFKLQYKDREKNKLLSFDFIENNTE